MPIIVTREPLITAPASPSTPDIPQFAAPFSISSTIDPETGLSVGAAEVAQGSEADIEAQVYNVLVCPQGFRLDEPEFGIPPLQFSNAPLPIDSVLVAVQRWVPDAPVSIVESILEGLEQQRALTVVV
jgi:hypothetical protein